MADLEKNLIHDTVVPSTTLVGAENYLVDDTGAKTTSRSQMAKGIVYEGFGANLASDVVISGEMEAYVDGTVAAISIGDPLTPDGADSSNGRSTVDGVFTKGTVGTDHIKATALEAASTITKIRVRMPA